jgi:hypothetical protein
MQKQSAFMRVDEEDVWNCGQKNYLLQCKLGKFLSFMVNANKGMCRYSVMFF